MHGFKWYPAAYLGGLNTVLAAVVAFGFFTQTTADYVMTIGTAVAGLVTWWTVRPVVMAVFTSLVTTIIVAIGGFGLHLSDAKVAGLASVVTLVAYGVLHLAGVPVAGSPAQLDPALAPLAHGGTRQPAPAP